MAEDTKNLYNPHDGLTGRDGGPYLDQEERRLAEIVRAAKEDREPDFENAPATAGTPLVDAKTLVAMANPASNPSQANADVVTAAVDKLSADEDFPVSVHSKRDLTDEEKEAKRLAASSNPLDNPANPTVVSVDDEKDSPFSSTKETKKTTSAKSSDTDK